MRLTLERVTLFREPSDRAAAPALDDVSLEVSSGEVVGLMGRTGAGKTTLLETMAGIVRPASGRVLLDGGDVARSADARRGLADARGMVLQIPERQFFEPTVERELAFGLRARGIRGEEARRRSEEALRAVGLRLDEVAGRSPLGLSGGQQRRVAVASVLALRPRLLLMDEPTSGLDAASRACCLGAVRRAAAAGAAVVVASHDADALAEVADRLVALEAGRVVLDGSARGLLGDPDALAAHGLAGSSAARALGALRRSGLAVEGPATSAAELARAIAEALAGGEGR